MNAVTDIRRPPSPPPITHWWQRLRVFHAFYSDLVGFVRRRFDALGDIYYVPGSSGGLYVVRHPDHIRDVLVTHAQCYDKSHSAFLQLARVLGQGLLNSDGEVWRRHRRMIQPAFHKERLRAYAQMMVEEADAMASRWRAGATIDLGAELTRVTLRVVSRALFTHEVGDDVDAITGAVSVLQETFASPAVLPVWMPGSQRHRARRALGSLNDVVYRLIAERRAAATSAGDAPADLLQRLLDARDEEGDGAGLSDREIRDQLVTFFLAGHETTSTALTWTFYLLSQHEDVCTKLGEEVDRVLGGRTPTFEDFDALTYTDNVVKEAMRIFPPVFAVARKCIADTRIGDYDVPAGSEVGLWIYSAHHDPRWYEAPEAFNPDRFDDAAAVQRMKNAYLPFGLGARTCIGKTFATVEAVLILATIAQRWRLSLAPGQKIGLKARVTLMPKYGMRMVAHARGVRP